MRGNRITELRQQMQQEREMELSRLGRTSEPPSDGDGGHRPRVQRDSDHYSNVREQRLAEERQYREQAYDDPRIGVYQRGIQPGRRWDENEPPSRHRVRFDESGSDRSSGPHPPRSWDDEEKELMSWARGRGRQAGQGRGRALTPPGYESPQKQAMPANSRLRSISAPVVAEGITSIGARDDSKKRDRQRQYAEELRAQIREKEEMKRKEKLDSQEHSPRERPDKKPPSVITEVPPRLQVERLQPPFVDEKTETDGPRRAKMSPRHDKHERYSPYYYLPPPAPPPHYANYHQYCPDYPPQWPPAPYHWPRPPYPPPSHYPMDPYYPHPPPPHMGNPYLPPEFGDWKRDRVEHDGGKSTRFVTERPQSKLGDEAGGPEWPLPLSEISGNSRGGKRLNKASYRAELEKQMQEKRDRDARKRMERENYDIKKAAEVYDPFGKEGCGAPVRDKHGKVVADLKQMRKKNEDKLLRAGSESPSGSPLPADSSSGRLQHQETSPSVSTSRDWKAIEEAQRKSAIEEYRESLKRQVEEKEEVKRREKEQLKLEEQRELERLEAERKKLQEDYKLEVEKQRRKEMELKAKNEALQRQLEERRRLEALRKQGEELMEAELAAEAKNQALTERLEQQPPHQQWRARSPPVPTVRHKMTHELFSELPPTPMGQPQTYLSTSPPVPTLRNRLQQHHQPPLDTEVPPHEHTDAPPPRGSPPVPALRNKIGLEATSIATDGESDGPPLRVSNSPPVPAVRNKMARGVTLADPPTLADQPRPVARDQPPLPETKVQKDSADVIKGLSDLRKHLQGEQSRVAKQSGATIFSNAMLPKPRLAGPWVRRGDAAPSSAALKEFIALKSSRDEFSEKFPNVPQSKAALDAEQVALLRHQEENLTRLRGKTRDTTEATLDVPIRHRNSDNLVDSASVRLPGSSQWEGPRHVPSEGLTSGGPKQPRRQWQQPPSAAHHRPGSPGAFSQFSVLTVDMDSIARKNAERERRLEAILNASNRPGNSSNPQAVLHSFLRRTDRGDALTKGCSQQSERSLDCETSFHPSTPGLNGVV